MSTDAREEELVKSRKLGSENAIVVQLPAERFTGAIPSHYEPPKDQQGRYRIMLLAQDCSRCSFGDAEAGAVREFHLWLQLGPVTEDTRPIAGAEVSLPSQQWLALFVATDNSLAEAHLRSFGFDPARIATLEIGAGGGSLLLHDGSRLEWFVEGEGRGPATIGVHHALFMPGDGLGAAPHRVAALIGDAVMGQSGKLRVQGGTLEPFLLSGEHLPALVHRMPTLGADVVWRPRPEAS